MPKDISERIIDSPFAPVTRSGTVSIGSGGGGGGGGAANLDALTDVTLTTPANGQTLSYNSGSGQWVNSTPAAMTAHALSGSFHTGKLNWPLIEFAGSNLNSIETRLHSDLQGIGPNDHHNQAHVLATGTALGADHTISGASVGEVLRALSATTAAFDVLQHTDLGNILPDQHHTRVHDIISGDASGAVHTIVGSQFQVVGATATDTLGLLTPSANPGAAAAILRTDANGSITLDGNLLFVDALNNRVGVNVTPGAGPAGGAAALDIRAAATGDITQRIRQIAGQTQRLWRVENTAGQELIVMDSVGNLQSGNPGFVSGLTGWQITPVGNAEFNNIWARGELHATVFVKDEVHATGGSFLVATAGTLHDDAIINSTLVDDDVLVVYSTPAGQGVPLQVVTTSGTFTGNELHVAWVGNLINVNDPPSGPGFYFQPGDIVRSKTEVATGVTDFWLEVNAATQYSGYSTYSVTKRSGTDGTLPKGSAVVSYGKQGDGRILMTSDLNYAPYIDVFTTGVNVWTGAAGAVIPRMRMGRLDGIGLPGISGVEQYGMIAGKDLSDANTGYLIASNLQFSLYKVDIRLNNGTNDTGLWTADGNLRIGSNIAADATTGFRVYTTSGGGYNAGDVVIGNTGTGNFLRWNQVSGMLQVVGNLTVSDPGTTVTKTYVDLQDSSYDSLAQGYGSTAQGNAITYSDARRVVGVSGTWTSPATNQVVWASAAVVFANGGSRAIAAPPAPGYFLIGVRTYLYVDLAGVTPMPMKFSTSVATVSGANNVLIAVCDPGDPAAPSAARLASITVVAGSTYISGGNIFTGSITATNIATGTITANKLDAASLQSTYLDPIEADVTTAQTTATTAQTTANNAATAASDNLIYTESHRIMTVGGVWDSTGINQISWSGVVVGFGDGNASTVTDGSFTNITGRRYIYIDLNATPPYTLAHTNLVGNFGPNHAVLAVADPGTTLASGGSGKATITIVGGSTYISGDNIMTGSIVANNIAAFTITADQIATRTISADRLKVDHLDGINNGTVYTGILELDSGSNIHSAGKPGYGGTPAPAGFFLGRDGTTYKFDIGDTNNYLRWTGTDLIFKTDFPLSLTPSASDVFLYVTSRINAGRVAQLQFDLASNNAISTDYLKANYQLSAQTLALDYTAGPTNTDIITFRIGARNDALHYNSDGAGVLAYSAGMTVAGSFIAGGQIISNSNAIRIVNASTPVNSSSAGSVGEIRWDDGYLYIRNNNGWRRIPTGNAF